MNRLQYSSKDLQTDSARLQLKLHHYMSKDKQNVDKIGIMSQQINEQIDKLREADKQKVLN